MSISLCSSWHLEVGWLEVEVAADFQLRNSIYRVRVADLQKERKEI